jgi:hypothetical protein
MSRSAQNCILFHAYVKSTYTAVLKWLDHRQEATGYRVMDYKGEVCQSLNQTSLKNSAFHYYTLFPAHYFKVVHTLKSVVGLATLLDFLSHNPHICIVDVGCGSGVGSAAFVGTILSLQERRLLTHAMDIFCLGVDPNPCAIAIYNQFMKQLRTRLAATKINLEYKVIHQGIPDAILPVIRALTLTREQWQQPYLPHVFVMQVNVVSPLSTDHNTRQESYVILKKLNVNSDVLVDGPNEFGHIEALAYKQLFEEVLIDRMHVITIGTDYYLWDDRVREMGRALNEVFSGKRHVVEKLGEGNQEVYYQNPCGSYWIEKAIAQRHASKFYVDISTITSAGLQGDEDWNNVISAENLKLAWARARNHLLGESLIDEIEIRLFEANLDSNLARLQRQLIAYASDVVRTDDRIFYDFPKDLSATRPRALSRMEEEILSVAVIQHLGQKVVGLRGCSYAYRLEHNSAGYNSEYLYEPWFRAYQKYIKEARDESQRHQGCVVIRTDIKSFFTRIVQDRLVQLTAEQLSKSQRIQWLLRLLLSDEMDDHEVGLGIVQGNIGSGFYANIYLTEVDAYFGPNNEWGVKFYRYVDDMILIVPDPEHVSTVLGVLQTKLNGLRLELNDSKTEIFSDVSKFLEETVSDERLELLATDFEQLVNALWITNSDYRTIFGNSFRDGEQWWYRIEMYQKCLQAIGIFVTAPILSRRVYRYLFNRRRCQDDLKRESELVLPSLPPDNNSEMIREWAACFEKENKGWIEDRSHLFARLADLFHKSWEELQQLGPSNPSYERKLARRLRFAANRLDELGFAEIRKELLEVLCRMPWLIREPAPIIEGLARQGFSDDIMRLLAHYSNDTSPLNEYMRAVTLRAIRYVPSIDSRLWDELVKYATGVSVVNSLSATETWLHLGHRCKHLIRDEHINAVKTVLHSNPPLVNRLRKNYLLILAKHDPSSIKDTPVNGDYMIRGALDVALEGDAATLFGYQEPEIIRQAYYSGQRPDDIDDSIGLDVSY